MNSKRIYPLVDAEANRIKWRLGTWRINRGRFQMPSTVREAYLQEARKADEKAEQSWDTDTAAIWRIVAENYRTLAADLEEGRKQDWH